MKRLKGVILYCFYLFICVELISVVILFSPGLDKRLLSVKCSSSWRIKFVRHHLIQHGSSYLFDQYDRTKGWNLKPNIRNLSVFDGKVLNSNSNGVPGIREYVFDKKPGVRRIVILGDSFTFGEDVNDNESYAYYLQQLVPSGVEVINLGIHGYGHDQMLLKLEEEGLRYQPDLVILGFYEGDMERNMLDFMSYAKPRYVLEDGKLRLTNVPIPSVKQILISEFFRSHFVDVVKIVVAKIKENAGRTEIEKKELTTALLDALRDTAHSANAKFLLLDIASVFEIFDAKPDTDKDFLFSYSETHQVPLLYPLPELQAGAERGTDCNRTAHYCPRLNKQLAEILYRYLQGTGWLKQAV